uniref:coilin isoform X2 n=1 Tax=Pristiophorus japonicus TaxID=55135 RepID=UPI00398F05E5
MAAVRLRLLFDYPPPLLPAGRLCWLLLQPEQCRVVADLESIIRRRFGFSSRTLLHLFLDNCLLPPNESVHLVRDNDSIRVKQEELITENGFVTSDSPDRPSVKPKKRHRHQHQPRSENGEKKKRRKGAGLSVEQKHDSTGETVSNKAPAVPQRDYSKLPLLAAPPQVGERIAFKVLELSESYTPELSDYKEGRIMSYNPSTQQVGLSVDSVSTESSKEPGKFDLIYQTENGEDMVEYAVTREAQVTESWSSLVEPRLIVMPAAEPVAVEMA